MRYLMQLMIVKNQLRKKMNKVLFKVLRHELVNGKCVYECEEKESGEKVLLKKNPKIKDQPLSDGKEYFLVVNENWINQIEPLQPETEDVKEKSRQASVPKKETVAPFDMKQHMITWGACQHDATELVAAKYSNKDMVDSDTVLEEVRNFRDKLYEDFMEKFYK